MAIYSGDPPTLIHIDAIPPVVVHVDQVPTVIVTQIPGVGPPGPAGPSGDASGVQTNLTAHLLDPTPHPVYDDQPSLVLLFENRLI